MYMSTRQINVFISHSTRAKVGGLSDIEANAHQQFVDEFCSFIEKKNALLKAFIDKKDIPPGATWRDILFGNLNNCHATVVFVNKDALDSEWVSTEVIVSASRRFMEKKFLLFIVPFGGVTAEEISKKPEWCTVNIQELQYVSRDSVDINNAQSKENAFEKIFQELKGLLANAESLSLLWIVRFLYEYLPDDKRILDQIAEKFPVNHERISIEDLRLGLAKEVYLKGPLAINDLLDIPALKQVDFDKLCIILATHWVDLAASVQILKNVLERKGSIFVINCKEIHYTPFMYIRQVCNKIYPWLIFSYGVNEASVPLDLYICSQIAGSKGYAAYLKDNKCDSPDALERKTMQINELMKTGAPVFISILYRGLVTSSEVELIQKKFVHLNIFICAEDGFESIVLSPTIMRKVVFLKPVVDIQEEEREFKDYCSSMTSLN